MKRNIFRTAIAAITLLISLTSCGRAGYQYNNLTSEEDMREFLEIMVLAEVPDQDIKTILEYIDIYRSSGFSKKSLMNGWRQTTKGYQQLYDYTNAINEYTRQEFEDINCRQAAFMIYHSFFQITEPEKTNLQHESQELPEYMNEELYNYEILFCRIPMEETVEAAVLNFWQDNGAVFGTGSVHLVSLWGVDDGEVINYHAGILIEEEAGVIFFEKTDPILPFQLSRFASVEEMKAYLLKREGVAGLNAVFLDDTPI